MRVAELSRRSGVSLPTIKYYLREGLLPQGERTSPNQAQYDEGHVRRLRLIRALVEVGNLSIAETREVLASIDSPGKTLHETLGKAQQAVTAPLDRPIGEAPLAAAARRVALLDDYAALVEPLAEKEVRCVLARPDLDSTLEGVVIGTVLGDILLAALRRMAHANASATNSPRAARAQAPAG
jgi:DNA-binding transcriptional MerR regulator